MYQATMEHSDAADIFIGAAAVADYRPAQVADQKIKKKADTTSIDMVKTKDILAEVAAIKANGTPIVSSRNPGCTTSRTPPNPASAMDQRTGPTRCPRNSAE